MISTQKKTNSFTFTIEPSIIEHKAYRDIWGGAKTHLDAYLKWFYEIATLLHEFRHESGSLYVHLDWHIGPYAKAILDEIFGADLLRILSLPSQGQRGNRDHNYHYAARRWTHRAYLG